MEMDDTGQGREEGRVRLLTLGEIALAKTVFMSTIDYYKIWVHHDSYFPFGLQRRDVSMAPNGELYFRKYYSEDFSLSIPFLQHMFIHEMSHVWQRANGMNVIGRGLVSFLVSYRYKLDGRLLSEYPMEQQAQIIADNFILQKGGYKTWFDLWKSPSPVVTLDGDGTELVVRRNYKNAMRGFPW